MFHRHKPANDVGANLALAIVMLAAVSAFWLINVLISSRSDIPAEDIVPMSGMAAGALVIEFGILFLTRRYIAPAFTILALLNTHCIYIILSTGIHGVKKAAVLVGIACFYFVAFDVASQKPRVRRWVLPSVPLVIVIYAIAGFAYGQREARASLEASSGVRMVHFIDKPNIYFLSFDAMLPASLSRKYLHIDAPAYIPVMRRYGAHFIPNMFSDRVPTKPSLANILKLIPDTVGDYNAIVTGHKPSPLRQILSANGYTTHFTFPVSYFGLSKGRFLDYYHVYSQYSFCSFLTKGATKRLAFFGYCWVRYGNKLDAAPKRQHGSIEDFSYTLIKQVANNKQAWPVFYMQHLLTPAHTSLNYAGTSEEFQHYRSKYERRSVEAARMMDRMLKEIRRADPSAIIFLYGDHGAWLSRAVKFKEEPEFFVQDRFGTLGAVINAERCLPFLNPPPGEHFQTTARVVTGLVQCLAGGKSPLSRSVDYGAINQHGEGARFEDYIYEKPTSEKVLY